VEKKKNTGEYHSNERTVNGVLTEGGVGGGGGGVAVLKTTLKGKTGLRESGGV